MTTPAGTDQDPIIERDHIHGWFGLTYAAYLVLPRSVLQSLPPEIQAQFVAALEATRRHLWPADVIEAGATYTVYLRDSRGRFVADPWRDYKRGRRRVTRQDLLDHELRSAIAPAQEG